MDIFAFIEGDEAEEGLRLAGVGVGEFGIGMEAWDGGVGPGAVQGLPRGDDPAVATLGAAGLEWSLGHFVGVGLGGESVRAF